VGAFGGSLHKHSNEHAACQTPRFGGLPAPVERFRKHASMQVVLTYILDLHTHSRRGTTVNNQYKGCCKIKLKKDQHPNFPLPFCRCALRDEGEGTLRLMQCVLRVARSCAHLKMYLHVAGAPAAGAPPPMLWLLCSHSQCLPPDSALYLPDCYQCM